MYKLLAMAILSIITSQAMAQAMAQDDSTSVATGFNVNGATSTISSPGDPNRAWTQAVTYLLPATTTNNYNTYNTYNTTTGGTCTTTVMAIVGYTNPVNQNWSNIWGGCAGPYSKPPTGTVYMGGPDACANTAWATPIWQSVCK